MKKNLSILLIICLIFSIMGTLPITIAADTAPIADFEYIDDGASITITKYKGTGDNVILPDTIDGKPVTNIGDTAFSVTGLINITIPSSVASIGISAFYGCQSLCGAYFEGNAPSLKKYAFDYTAPNFKIYYLSNAQGFTSPTWQGYPTETYSQTKIVSLNTPDNLVQHDNAIQAVSFIATPASGENVDANNIEWYVNGAKQPQTGTIFSYTPTGLGSYAISVRVTGYSTSDIDSRTITVMTSVLEVMSGILLVEAEKTTFSKTNLCLIDNKWFSGGKGLSVTTEDKTQPTKNDAPDIDLSFKADKAGTYIIWLRAEATQENNAGNSIFVSIGGGDYQYTKIKGEPGNPLWGSIGKVTVSEAGSIASIKIIRRQMTGIVFDRFIITNDLAVIPADAPILVTPPAPTPAISPKPTASPIPTATAKTISVSKSVGVIGKSAEIAVDIDPNTQMVGGSFVLNYDDYALVSESYMVGSALDGATVNVNLNYQDPVTGTPQIKVNWISSNALNTGGELIKVRFKIQESVEDQTTIPIALSDLALSDLNANPLSCTPIAGGIIAIRCLVGDVNEDGKINILDAFLVLRYDAGLTTFTDKQKIAADFNTDGKIDIFDAVSIQKHDLDLKDNPVADIAKSACSSCFDNNDSPLSYDVNPDTMWSAQGVGEWVSYEFETAETIGAVYVLLNKATERQAFFDLQTSTDGINYTTVLSCTSDGCSNG